MNKSSHIRAASYDSDAHRMTIEFKNGRRYEFDQEPGKPSLEELHSGLHSASSPGSFFHQRIKPQFTGRLVKTNGT